METFINDLWDAAGILCVVYMSIRLVYLEHREQERKNNGI